METFLEGLVNETFENLRPSKNDRGTSGAHASATASESFPEQFDRHHRRKVQSVRGCLTVGTVYAVKVCCGPVSVAVVEL